MRLKQVESFVVIAPIVRIARTAQIGTTIINARKTVKIPHSVAIEPRRNANRVHRTARVARMMALLLRAQHERRAQAIAAHATKINKA